MKSIFSQYGWSNIIGSYVQNNSTSVENVSNSQVIQQKKKKKKDESHSVQ